MHTRTFQIPFLCLLLSAGICFARTSVAVADLSGQGLRPEETALLSDRFRTELVGSGNFEVMERAQMDAVLKEQGFQQTGACTSDQCLVQVGQLLGVEKLVSGTIGKLGSMYMVNARIIDIQTGRIDKTVSEDCSGGIENMLPVLARVARRLGDTVSATPAEVSVQPPVQPPPSQPLAPAASQAIVQPRTTTPSTPTPAWERSWMISAGGVYATVRQTWGSQIPKNLYEKPNIWSSGVEIDNIRGGQLTVVWTFSPHWFLQAMMMTGSSETNFINWDINATGIWNSSKGKMSLSSEEQAAALGAGVRVGETWRFRGSAAFAFLHHVTHVNYFANNSISLENKYFPSQNIFTGGMVPGILLTQPPNGGNFVFDMQGTAPALALEVNGEYKSPWNVGIGMLVRVMFGSLSQPTMDGQSGPYVLVDTDGNESWIMIPLSVAGNVPFDRTDMPVHQLNLGTYLFYEF